MTQQVKEILYQNKIQLDKENPILTIEQHITDQRDDYYCFWLDGQDISNNNNKVSIKLSNQHPTSLNLNKTEINIKQKLMQSNSIVKTFRSLIEEEKGYCIQILEKTDQSIEDLIKEVQEKKILLTVKQLFNLFLEMINQLIDVHSVEAFYLDILPKNICKCKDKYKIISIMTDQQGLENGQFTTSNKSELEQKIYIFISDLINEDPKDLDYYQSSNIYNLGIIFLQLMGLEVDQIVSLVHSNNYLIISQQINNDYLTLFTFVRAYMTNKDPQQRYEAINLRETLIQFDQGQCIDFLKEQIRLREVIEYYESNKKEDLFLAFQYYCLSQVLNTVDKYKYIKQAISCLSQLNHLSSFAYKLYEFDYISITNYAVSHMYNIPLAQIFKKSIEENSISSFTNRLNQIIYEHVFSKVKKNPIPKLQELQKDIQDEYHPVYLIAGVYMGVFCQINDWLDKFQIFHNKSLKNLGKSFNNNHLLFAQLIRSEGLTKYSKEDWKAGSDILQKEVALIDQLPYCNELYKGGLYLFLGTCYKQQSLYEQSLLYEYQSYQAFNNYFIKAHEITAVSMRYVGFSYLHLNEFEKALECDLNVLKMRRELYPPNNPLVLQSLLDVGISYVKVKQFSTALIYRLERLNILKEKQDGSFADQTAYFDELYRVSELYMKCYKYTQSIKFYRKILDLELSQENQRFSRIINIFQYLISIYKQLDDQEEEEALEIKKNNFIKKNNY